MSQTMVLSRSRVAVVVLLALAAGARVGVAAGGGPRDAGPVLKVADVFPANKAKDISPDVPLRIRFEGVGLGAGKIQIFDAAEDTLVEAIDVGVALQTQPMGGTPQKYYPVTISGNEAAVHFKNHALAYGKSYYVTIDAGVFSDKGGGGSTAAVAKGDWQFGTRAAGPAAGLTKITVAADGSGDFCTVQGALDFIPENNAVPTTVFLKKGTYTEMIFLRAKNRVTLIGEDRKGSVIAYSNTAKINQRRSVMQVNNCNDFVMSNLTVWNTTPKLSGGNQAEAIIYGGALTSRAVLNRVDLKSFQDTLQINDQAYVSDSYIEGDIDFMWGSGPVFFENVTAKMLTGGNDSYVETRNPPTNHGFVYYHCNFTSVEGLTGNHIAQNAGGSEVVLLDCVLGENIRPVGWRLNAAGAGRGGAGARGGAATSVAPGIRYFEFNSHHADGKPVDMSQRLPESRELKQPADAELIGNYSNPVWVLGNNWVPMVPGGNVRSTVAVVKPAGAVRLSVTFGFAPDATYQWKKNGVEIANARAGLLEIKAVTPADAGEYTVTVTSGKTVTASAPATLKIGE